MFELRLWPEASWKPATTDWRIRTANIRSTWQCGSCRMSCPRQSCIAPCRRRVSHPGDRAGGRRKGSRISAKGGPATSERDVRVHDAIGRERFCTLTNAEIMRDTNVKKPLRAEGLDLGQARLAKRCLDRIRRRQGLPAVARGHKKTGKPKPTTGKNGQRHAPRRSMFSIASSAKTVNLLARSGRQLPKIAAHQ